MRAQLDSVAASAPNIDRLSQIFGEVLELEILFHDAAYEPIS